MATAEILFFFIATATRLFHPVHATEKIKGFRLVPDFFHAVVVNIGAIQARQLARGMTRQSDAVGGNGQEGSAPAVHAGFGPIFIKIRHDIVDFHFTGDSFFKRLRDGFGFLELLLSRQQ